MPAILILLFVLPFQDQPRQPNRGAPAVRDAHYAIALRYAPYIYHATHETKGRQDIITNIDFDGDLIGENNWENFELYELKPTVYYAVLETWSHYFISYHLFHPRDWAGFTFYVHDTHENDGENLQVVVRKSDGRVVLLWTQAHYASDVYVNSYSGITSGDFDVSGEFQTVDDAGIPSPFGTHAAVFVESHGHGIYGTLDSDSEVHFQRDSLYTFDDGSGLLFRPVRGIEEVLEPASYQRGEVPYQLESTLARLWPLVRRGEIVGDGKLFDGVWRYRDDLVDVPVPRYYDADRFSGPFGSDRGISPFALDLYWQNGTLGALFFNPAKRYQELLIIEGEWSSEYVGYPFR
ncbi:MAG: hypothetical protein HY563_06760 [Ignavibacteriales bacterium]|nr:hypothetical protein [Ignavibacteriales bacterium]